MGEASWAGLGAVIGAMVTAVFAWLTQRGRGEASIQVAAIAQWEKLYSAMSDRVSALEKQLAEVRRKHADEIDMMRHDHRAEMRVLRELNEGLQRQILQNSQSTAQMLSDRPDTRAKRGGHGE